MIPIVAGLLMGAAMGGGIAALQGKDVLQGALMGGAGGALGGALMPAAGGIMGGEAVAGTVSSSGAAPVATESVTSALSNSGNLFAGGSLNAGQAGLGLRTAGTEALMPSTFNVPASTTAGSGLTVPTSMANATAGSGAGGVFGGSGSIGDFLSANKYALLGGAAGGAMAPGEKPPSPQGNIREFTYDRGEVNPLFGKQAGASYYTGGGYTAGPVTPVEDYTAANGGIIALAEGGQAVAPAPRMRPVDPAVTAYNAQLMERANQQYNVNLRPSPNQVPGSVGYVAPPTPTTPTPTTTTGQVGGITFDRATGTFSGELNPLDGKSRRARGYGDIDYADLDARYMRNEGGFDSGGNGGGNANGGLMRGYNEGGISTLGNYSDGGQLLKGPGDGVSDDIPARIGNRQPARLADGEFVVPARVVSEIGNGSTDAGAKRLYAMMDRVQKARKKSVGKGKVAVDSKAHKMLPA